jgi:glutaredoxin
MKVLTIILVLLALPLNAELYKWVDEKGVINYSDIKPENKTTQEIIISNKSNKITNNSDTKENSLFSNSTTLEKPSKNKNRRVVMYSASWCGYCNKARAYFIQNNIKFKEYDIEKNSTAKRKYKKLGGSGVPLIVMGNRKMQGFNETKFKQFYTK